MVAQDFVAVDDNSDDINDYNNGSPPSLLSNTQPAFPASLAAPWLPNVGMAETIPPFLQSYTPTPGVFDELWRREASAPASFNPGAFTQGSFNPGSPSLSELIQPHWRGVIQNFAALGNEGIAAMQQEAQRMLRDNGVTYNVHGDVGGHQRPWPLDLMPLVLSESDWETIRVGVQQRAHLLNLMLTDIYGERRLLRQGILPAALIYGHSGFLRACHELRLPYKQQLILYGTDLARGPDGQMWVVSDRTQAPSGAGYALENRTVMARLMQSAFRDDKIQRLSNYFRTLQNTLAESAFQHKELPRTVILTPGPYNETYFEHAYLAAYLGYSLVQGDDLTVSNGRLSLKALSGLQPVDVILRRVDDSFCDPLELRADSRLGVAGLLESARRQNVTIINPLGSGVLENPRLMPFMPSVARYFLGEDLKLPSAATWWCGQQKEMDYVLEHLSTLVIRRVARSGASATLLGAKLSAEELQTLRQRILAEPEQYVGQEQISFSTAPAFVNHHCEPRNTILRTFAVATGNDYEIMPGGLARSAPASDTLFVSNSAGGISKDVWVLTAQPQAHSSLWRQVRVQEQALHSSQFLSSRSADNLFWVGRYAERADFTARLLRTIFDYFGEDTFARDTSQENTAENSSGGEAIGNSSDEKSCLKLLLQALTQVTQTYPGFFNEQNGAPLVDPVAELLSIVLDRTRIGGLHANLSAMINAAYAVRDLWSVDSWRVLNSLEEPWQALAAKSQVRVPRVHQELNNLITSLMAFSGLNTESMTHSAAWLLLDTGRRLERAQLTTAFIRATMSNCQEENIEPLLLEMILKTTDTIITYRRRYRSHIQPSTLLDLLLMDEQNPRALGYQLATLQAHLAALPRQPNPYQLSQEERLLLQASTRLRLANTLQLAQPLKPFSLRYSLDEMLAELTLLLNQISDVLTRTYFIHSQTPQQLLSQPMGSVV